MLMLVIVYVRAYKRGRRGSENGLNLLTSYENCPILLYAFPQPNRTSITPSIDLHFIVILITFGENQNEKYDINRPLAQVLLLFIQHRNMILI